MAKAKKNMTPRVKAKPNIFKDSDADGLFDCDEKKLGTNPKKCDSDNDGLNDYEEVHVYGTDPLNPDTDADGMKDGVEVKRGLNPRGSGLINNLFIPNIHNNFKPQSLHPKRIIFYSLSAILFKAILVVTVMILPVEAWLTPDILTEQGSKIISLTNTIRKNLNLAILTESPLLNRAAYGKAEDMLLNQYFAHTGPGNKTLADWLVGIKYNYAVAGENLAMGFASPEEVVNGWTRSQTHYQNMIDPDFKEIGVGIVSGLYTKIDTTLVAQYFASPLNRRVKLTNQPPLAVDSKSAKPTAPPPAQASGESQLLGEKVKGTSRPEPTAEKAPEKVAVLAEVKPIAEPAEIKPGADSAALATTSAPAELNAVELPVASVAELPKIDLIKSKLYVNQPQGKAEKIVRAEVYASSDAVKVQVNFNNYFINLQPAEEEPSASAALPSANLGTGGTSTSATLDTSKWVGQTIIFKEDREQIFNPVVLGSVTAENQAGSKVTEDLAWDNIQPAKTTLLKQYYFIKQHQSPYIQPLFNVTSIFYKIILIVALIALGLNVVIQIKKQYPRVILSTLGLIALLILLIIL